MNVLVSIIIPTYNRAHLIGETLESIIAQTYQNWECIIVDDGSSDYTDELMFFYCGRDGRIKYHHRPKGREKSANVCRNYGFELSKGEFIQYLDSDDLLSEHKIEEQVEILLQRAPNTVAICAWAAFDKEKSRHILKKDPDIFKSEQTAWQLFDSFGKYCFYLPPHCYLVRRSQVIKAGGWNEFLSINQDGEFFSRLLLLVDLVVFSHRSLVFYRRNKELSTSSYDSLRKAEDVLLSWKLIEQQHKLRYRLSKIPYVEGTKNMVYRNLKDSGFNEIIKANAGFFKKQIQGNTISPLKKSLKRILSKTYHKIFRNR